MLSMFESHILPELRRLAGERRVTLIFDREGWSPDSFSRWFEKGFDVITYRKGKYDAWSEDCFGEVESEVGGKAIVYRLGQRSVKVGKNFWMREVRRLCDSGHQTSVMTTRQDLDAEEIARRMFFRWNQENFFRYMRLEYNLDHLVTYDVEKADPERLVPCPKRKERIKMIAKLKVELEKHEKEYGRRAIADSDSPDASTGIVMASLKRKIGLIEDRIEKAKAELKQMPKRVPLKAVVEHEIVRLEKERKTFTDALKMICYRTETSMLNLVGPQLVRAGQEGRAFLKSVFELAADILPDEASKTLTVRFHTMANERSNAALRSLCEIMNAESCLFPKTDLRLVFTAPSVASEIITCQEF
jgi:hypothetical protein